MNRMHRIAAAALLTLAGFAYSAPAQAAAEPPACTEEGFFPNPDDQTRFYRCVDFGDGTFTRFDFQCGPGTLYHPELATCVHPWQMPQQ